MLANDPTVLAWFITAAYFGGSVLSLLAARAGVGERDRVFWLGCAALLLILGFNKQLDLQGFVTTAGRSLAREGGWFEQRRLVQAGFIVLLCTAAAALTAALAVWLRRSAGSIKIAALGIVLLVAFVAMRAASFHHMDIWVTRSVAGMRSGWWLELAGIAAIGIPAMVYRSRPRAAVEGRLD
jgi:hypothetical protein